MISREDKKIFKLIYKSNLTKEEKELVINYIKDGNSITNKELLVSVLLKLLELCPKILDLFSSTN